MKVNSCAIVLKIVGDMDDDVVTPVLPMSQYVDSQQILAGNCFFSLAQCLLSFVFTGRWQQRSILAAMMAGPGMVPLNDIV